MRTVGVFRDAPVREVLRIARHLRLDAVQLHGSEDADAVRTLRRNLPSNCETWPAPSVGRAPLDSRHAARTLFDNADGGSGQVFGWARIAGHAELPRALVAGGIGPRNARAARALGAFAIDIGSAVDEQPGRKSPEKIGALFDVLPPTAHARDNACA